MTEHLDFDKALATLQNCQDLTGKGGILTQNWNLTLSQLSIYFEDWLDNVLDI